MVTEFNKTFSGQQRRRMVEGRVNQRFENHFCSRLQGTDEQNRDGSPSSLAFKYLKRMLG
jgi:hypothetical protein